MNDETTRHVITVPQGARENIRKNLNIGSGPLRVSYISGAGDVVGTYNYWRRGMPDPRVPSVTYSSQMYELTRQLGASLQVLTGFTPPQATGPQIRFTKVTRPAWQGRVQYFQSQTKYMREVVGQISNFDPHVVIVGVDFPAFGWHRLKQGRKLVLTAHNTFWPMGRKPVGIKSALRMKLLEHHSKALDGAVCTSDECARQISTVTKGRINGLVEHPQILARYPLQERAKVQKLLYLGRIERSKGIFMLLKVFADLKQHFPDLTLSFAGSGSCDSELTNAIAYTGLPNLQFLGQLDSAGVHREIAAADLVVCPTMSTFPEGLALVGLEAAAHGIPTLQSSIVPAIDLLGDACKTFQVDSLSDLRRVLSELLSDESSYTKLIENLTHVRPRLYRPSLSWGSQLAHVLLALKDIPQCGPSDA